MIIRKIDDVPQDKISMEGVSNASIQWLIGEKAAAPNFYLRRLELGVEGHTPLHSHPWEHEVYVLDGKGQINTGNQSFPLEANSFAFVKPEEMHQFENTGDTPFRFLCIIPTHGK